MGKWAVRCGGDGLDSRIWAGELVLFRYRGLKPELPIIISGVP
jgi:hypothetical protein